MYDLNNTQSLSEVKLDRAISAYEAEMQSLSVDMVKLYEEIGVGTESADTNLSKKEKSFVEAAIQSMLKSSAVVDTTSDFIARKAAKFSLTLTGLDYPNINAKAFESTIGYHIVPFAFFQNRPSAFRYVQEAFRNISRIMKDPVINGDVYGPSIRAIIEKITGAGFTFKNIENDRNPLLLENFFNIPDAALPRSGMTVGSLGYTVNKTIELANLFTGNKNPGYFRTLWTSIKVQNYTHRFLWDLLVGRSGDDVNRFEAIRVRTLRLDMIKSISLYQGWFQLKHDMACMERLLSYLVRSTVAGYETLNLTSVDPYAVAMSDEVSTAVDIDVQDDENIITPEIQQDLQEQEASVEALRKSHKEKMRFSYPSEGIKKMALSAISMEQLARNRILTNKILELHSKRKMRNEKLLQTFESMMILLGRLKLKVVPPISKSVLAETVVPNIVRYDQLNPRVVAYNEIRNDFTTSVSCLYENVEVEHDLGPSIEKFIEKLQFGGIEVRDASAMESCAIPKMFDTEYYGKRTMNLADAGYSVMDLFRFASVFEHIQRTLRNPDPTINGLAVVGKEHLMDTMVRPNQSDKVDAIAACKARRVRYSVLSAIRTEVLLDSAIRDCAMLIRMLSAIAAKN